MNGPSLAVTGSDQCLLRGKSDDPFTVRKWKRDLDAAGRAARDAWFEVAQHPLAPDQIDLLDFDTGLHCGARNAAGYTHSLFALMEKYEELLRFANHGARMLEGETGHVWKEYALFARGL